MNTILQGLFWILVWFLAGLGLFGAAAVIRHYNTGYQAQVG